jgi:aspartoacylase
MAKAWPCGLVLEVGPVAQGVICPRICQQTGIGVHTLLELLAQARFGKLNLPNFLKVHRHLGSLDLPKDLEGNPIACLHPDRLKGDWQSLKSGDPLFVRPDGIVHLFKADSADQFRTVFTNEAAYQEKNIALSLTRIEKIKTQPEWLMALKALLQG